MPRGVGSKCFEIVLDLGIIYGDDELDAYEEASRIMHDNGSVDWHLAEHTPAPRDTVREAAPDLLAACERAVDDIMETWAANGDRNGVSSVDAATVDTLRAAIAKAKGGA